MLSHLLLCWQVPKSGPALPRPDVTAVISDPLGAKRQQAYKTEIVGGVVVQTPIQVIKRKPWLAATWLCPQNHFVCNVKYLNMVVA